MGNKVNVSQLISIVDFQKLGMKYSLWEIKLCISVNIYHRLLKMENKVMYLS